MYEGSLCFTAPCNPNNKEFPIYEHLHEYTEEGAFAIIAGYVYTGPSCEALRGLFVYGDYVTGNLWTMTYDGTTGTNALLIPFSATSPGAFGRDEQGDVYIASLRQDRIVGFACAQAVSVEAEAVGGPLVVGADGGRVSFDVTLTNTTGQSQTVDYWVDADLSDGSEVEAVAGPTAATLSPGESDVLRVEVDVPAGWPLGTSTLTVKVGTYPDGPISADRLTMQKTAVPATEPPAPSAFYLAPPRPNPTASTAVLALELPAPAPVRLAVYDVLGRAVLVLHDGPLPAGPHRVGVETAGLPPGAYLVRMETPDGTQTQPLTVVGGGGR
jgi:hypothetical protein